MTEAEYFEKVKSLEPFLTKKKLSRKEWNVLQQLSDQIFEYEKNNNFIEFEIDD